MTHPREDERPQDFENDEIGEPMDYSPIGHGKELEQIADIAATDWADPAAALRNIGAMARAALASSEALPSEPTEKDIDFLRNAARLNGWIEGWYCARTSTDSSEPPLAEVREALALADFSDEFINAALASPGHLLVEDHAPIKVVDAAAREIWQPRVPSRSDEEREAMRQDIQEHIRRARSSGGQ